MNEIIKRKILYIISNINYRIIPDKYYLQMAYKKKLNKSLNLDEPVTFNEKIQWLKLNDRKVSYTDLVDKLNVREYVKEKIGERYLNKLYRVYDKVEDINIKDLPSQFVLKTNHDSGGVIVCKDKQKIDWNNKLKEFKIRLKQNYYYLSREYHYKDVVPKIICEELLVDDKYGTPLDYKIFCFNGTPLYVQVDIDRFSNHTRNFYDAKWNLQSFRLKYNNSNQSIDKPENLDEMLELAKKLSSGIAFCRVDFFYVNKKTIFGEITFFPESGYGEVIPNEYEKILGDLIDVSLIK